MQLYNKYNKETLLRKLDQEDFRRQTISFYQYARIEDPQRFRDELYSRVQELGVLGRIYVAAEGINAQINCPEHHIEAFRDLLYSYPFLNGIRLNLAVEEKSVSFLKLVIKVRQKIVNQTRLTQTNEEADWEISGYISDYSVSTAAISNQQNATDRLNISVHITIYDRLANKTQEYDITRSFDYSATQTLEQVQVARSDEIITNLTDEIFNKLFSNW